MSLRAVEAALEQATWLRALARRLARDPALAEELVQDTWIRAMEQPPRGSPGPGSLRAWLARVLANELRQRRRAEERRRRREREGARPEAQPSTAELHERFALQRRVVDAVNALDGPAREVILLRFFEGLPPRAIARRLGLPVRTVESRLRRAIERLRGRLDDLHGGDRRARVLALASLGDARTSWKPVAAGAAMAGAKTLVGAVAIGAAGLLGWSLWTRGEVAQVDLARPPAVAPPGLVEPPPAAEPERRARETEDAEPGEGDRLAPAGDEAPEGGSPAWLAGRAFLSSGEPAEGVALVLTDPSAGGSREGPGATTDSAGAFRFDVPAEGPPRGARILAADGAFVTVVFPEFWNAPRFEAAVIVAPNAPLGGAVTDASGLPLRGAAVRLEPPEGLRSRADAVFESSEVTAFRATTDEAGRWALDPRPSMEGARLVVSLDGHGTLEVAAPLDARADLDFVLAPLASEAGLLEGVVLDPAGVPVEDVAVGLGDVVELSGADGRFAFRLDEVERPDRLTAVHRDWLPARVDGVPGAPWPPFVELRFRERPRALAGRVVDARGQPVASARVWITDPELIGYRGDFPRHVEDVLGGSDRMWRFVETDETGAFTLPGVTDRSVLLRAMDARTTLIGEPTPARPGEPALLRLPTDELRARLDGIVRDGFGRPVPGVRVQVVRETYAAVARDGARWVETVSGTSAESDGEGRFVLQDVPPEGVLLSLAGPGIFRRSVELRPGADAAPLELAVARECHLRIEVARADLELDGVRLVDAAGDAVAVLRLDGDLRRIEWESPLVEGRQTLVVPDTARAAVLLGDGVEVLRLPVELVPGELVRLRP